MKQITATLENWYVDEHRWEGEYIIWGDCIGDSKRRFRRGTNIHTSGISEDEFPPNELKRGNVVHTRNSVYKLGDEYQSNTYSNTLGNI